MTGQSKVLFTGATGILGGQAVSQLRHTGADVRVCLNPDSAGLPNDVEVVAVTCLTRTA